MQDNVILKMVLYKPVGAVYLPRSVTVELQLGYFHGAIELYRPPPLHGATGFKGDLYVCDAGLSPA